MPWPFWRKLQVVSRVAVGSSQMPWRGMPLRLVLVAATALTGGAQGDAFDAMSSARAYRGALDKEHALGEVRDNAGSQFDPELATLFMKVDLADYDRMLQKHVAQDQGE